jgi:hypothetical protein
VTPDQAMSAMQRHDLETLVMAGKQKLDVTVKRDKSGDAGVNHPVVDWTELSSLERAPHPIDLGQLPLPSKVAEGDGPVSIEISIGATTPDVQYRLPTIGGNSSHGTIAEERFSATLRPRGPFGLQSNFRVFLTIPTQFVGLRLPANPSNIQSSSQSAAYEWVTFRAGIHLGIEPWDYRRGKSRYAIPFRFLFGLNLVGIGGAGAMFDPTGVVAFAVTLPVFQEDGKAASQVGTSLAIGPSFEVDLRDGHQYFLVNIGVDIFTLLAPK